MPHHADALPCGNALPTNSTLRGGNTVENTADNTVAVTGISLVTANGDDTDTSWRNICAGQSGIVTNTLFDTSDLLTTWAGMISTAQDPEIDRCYALSSTAVDQALHSADLRLSHCDPSRIAVIVGSSLGAMPTLQRAHARAIRDGDIDDEAALTSQLHCVADHIATHVGAKGPRAVTSNACAAGAIAIGFAAEMLWAGDVDVVICGGVDPLASLSSYGFSCLGALDPNPCSPMSASTGLTLGEGAGFLILERHAFTRERNAHSLAVIAGYGTSCDGYHQTAPDPSGQGAYRSMSAALNCAGHTPDQVDYINLHGTGTPTNDAVEPKAISLLFGDQPRPPASSVKSSLGHTLGAAGAIETVCTVLAITQQMLPPTINTRDLPAPSGLDIVPDSGRPARVATAMSNSFAFGGNNASIVVCSPDQRIETPDPTRHDAVITGVGALAGSIIGCRKLASLMAGYMDRDGDGFDPALVGGRADLKRAVRGVNPAKARRLDPLSIVAAASVNDLYSEFGKLTRVHAETTGIVFATGYGPVSALLEFDHGIITSGIQGANPLVFPNTVVNAAAGHLAVLNRYRGYTATIASGGTSSVMALDLASRVIRRGGAERIMVVIADEFPPLALEVAAQHNSRHGTGTGVRAPISDGAVAVLVESRAAATERQARILGTIRGFGATGQLTGLGRTGDDGHRWGQALTTALTRAELKADQIGTVISAAHGSGQVEAAEAQAFQDAGLRGRRVFSPKTVWGDTQGSSAGLGLAAALLGTDQASPILLSSYALGGAYAAMVIDGPCSA
ncbi:beta-ketoacyl-[acyl-carrier-protein] synthase family protein [Devriesea agamarum]|uniref:beta-ketoacyl-[acyl-carrier-protein] synthase family protein n=1 Tax=Devriesea agamarum TaxID=472569 RepID=UPI0009FC3A6B|nr:beta-ketoacyl-[acyl-carrier-protein] synthase family protein [Devriesea agamarum]